MVKYSRPIAAIQRAAPKPERERQPLNRTAAGVGLCACLGSRPRVGGDQRKGLGAKVMIKHDSGHAMLVHMSVFPS